MASPTQWTWVWVSSGSWWWTGRPGTLQQFMGSQRVGHDWVTELNWTELLSSDSLYKRNRMAKLRVNHWKLQQHQSLLSTFVLRCYEVTTPYETVSAKWTIKLIIRIKHTMCVYAFSKEKNIAWSHHPLSHYPSVKGASRAVLVVKSLPANTRDSCSIPGSRRALGGGHGKPLRYPCLGNSMGRGAWRATVHKATNSWPGLSDWAVHSFLLKGGKAGRRQIWMGWASGGWKDSLLTPPGSSSFWVLCLSQMCPLLSQWSEAFHAYH